MDDLCRFRLLTECRPAVVARGKGGGGFRAQVEDAADDQAGGKTTSFVESKGYSVR